MAERDESSLPAAADGDEGVFPIYYLKYILPPYLISEFDWPICLLGDFGRSVPSAAVLIGSFNLNEPLIKEETK